MGDPKTTAGVIFAATYLSLILFKKIRPYCLWGGVLLSILAGLISWRPWEFLTDVNWNVMGIFVGTLILADLFIRSRVPELIADWIIDHSPNVGMASVLICLISSLLSIFIENVACVLIVAPIALQMARNSKMSPVPLLIGIAIASNLQGTATLIGDPPSMILASYEKMNFLDFFIYKGKLSIFFAVQLGALTSMSVLYLLFRGNTAPVKKVELVEVMSWTPVYLIAVMVLLLALSSIVDPDFRWFGGAMCMVMAVAGMIWARSKAGSLLRLLVKDFDWGTMFFLAGVFVLVAMLERTGLIDDLAHALSSTLGTNPAVVFTAIVTVSVAFSAFIDNVPYIMAMIPVVTRVSLNLGVPHELMVFGLLIGACLGGNITPVGASANIVSVGLLKREGYHVGFGEFVKIGLPFTLAATIPAALFVWGIWR